MSRTPARTWRRVAALLTGMMLLGTPAVAAPAAAKGSVAAKNADENDEILVEIRVDQQILAESLAARQGHDGGLLLPLAELARALGLAIEVQTAAGTASGFVLREDRRFQLDVGRKLAVLAGRPLPLDPAQIEVRPEDIYVDTRQLASWLPLGLEFDPYGLIVRVLPREPLPAQLRLERERRNEQGGEAPVDPQYPFVPTPYALVGQPAIDPTFGLTFNRDDAGQIQPGLTYASLVDMDLLGLNLAGYATGTNLKPLLDWHLTGGRKDPDGGLLGPLRAREASLGYVLDPGIPLIAGTWTGNGATLSSYPLTQPARFDRQSFRGPLPPGWDAQLFQNGFPIAYQPASATGEYRFDDVPLAVGPNDFRIVLNGPQGQRREDVRRLNIGATLTPQGERRYRLTQGLDALGNPRTSAIYEQGITRQLSAAAGVSRMTLIDGSTHAYGLAGVRGTVGELFFHADAAAADNTGVAGEVGAQYAAGAFGVSLAQSVSAGLVSEEFRPEEDPIMARTSARMDAQAPNGAILPATASLTGTLERRQSGGLTPLIGNQLSTRLGPITLSNVLALQPNQGGPFTDGTAEVGGQVREFGLRGQVYYSPTAITQLALVTSGQAAGGYRWTVGTQFPLATRLPQLSVDVGHAFGGLTAGLNVTATYPGTVTTALSLQSGLSWGAAGLETSPVSLATTGSAEVHAFVDANQNGHMDPGERPLPGLIVDVGGNTPVRTNARGVAIATGLAAYTPVDADFSRIVLDDPLLVPALKGVRYVPRPGKTTVIELAIVAVGEIYGTVRAAEGGAPHDFPGATVELVDAQGRIVMSTVSGLDGYYGLTEVRPGHYQLRIAPAQLEKLGMSAVGTRNADIPGEGTVLDGQDFLLTPVPRP